MNPVAGVKKTVPIISMPIAKTNEIKDSNDFTMTHIVERPPKRSFKRGTPQRTCQVGDSLSICLNIETLEVDKFSNLFFQSKGNMAKGSQVDRQVC